MIIFGFAADFAPFLSDRLAQTIEALASFRPNTLATPILDFLILSVHESPRQSSTVQYEAGLVT
jgi:hypothetical protein